MLVALVNDFIVVEVKELTEEELTPELINKYSNVIDVSNDNPTPGVGWVFDGNKIVAPNAVAGKVSMTITKFAFRQRFTLEELAYIYSQIYQYPLIKVLIDNVTVADSVNLEDTDTNEGVLYLVSLGLLEFARAEEILSTPPTALELYKGTK